MWKGARGYFVVFGAFLSRVLDYGVGKSFGVLLTTLTEQFDILVWRVGNTVSLLNVVGIIGGISAMSCLPARVVGVVYHAYMNVGCLTLQRSY